MNIISRSLRAIKALLVGIGVGVIVDSYHSWPPMATITCVGLATVWLFTLSRMPTRGHSPASTVQGDSLALVLVCMVLSTPRVQHDAVVVLGESFGTALHWASVLLGLVGISLFVLSLSGVIR